MRGTRWSASVERFAVCPIVEGALLRYLLRVGESPASARAVLAAVRSVPTVEFWSDSVSWVDTDLDHVRGHRQVTDAYLAGIARARHDAFLATLDEGLAREVTDVTLLVPRG